MQPLLCPNCHKGIPRESTFCLHCGTPIPVFQNPPPAQPPPLPEQRYRPAAPFSQPPQPVYQQPPPMPQPPAAGMQRQPDTKALGLTVGIVVLLVLCAFIVIVANMGKSTSSPSGFVSSNSGASNSAPTSAAAQVIDTPTALPTLNPLAAVTSTAQANAQSTVTALAGAVATVTAGAASAGKPPGSTSYFYANATSHSVDGFGDAFAKFGGVASLGYPITQPFIEQNAGNSKYYWVQYFEKAQVEYHQGEGTDPFQLAPLGGWRFNQKYASGVPVAKAVPGNGSQLFPETKHTVTGLFLNYWKSNGDLARFGYPISESFDEKNDTTGKTYAVQYFERVEMEYHPELKAGSQVQLTALGALKLAQVYTGGAPSGASNPVPSPTVNAPATAQAQRNATSTVETKRGQPGIAFEFARAVAPGERLRDQRNRLLALVESLEVSPAMYSTLGLLSSLASACRARGALLALFPICA